MNTPRPLPAVLLWLGASALVLTVPVMIGASTVAKEAPWLAGTAVFLTCAAVVLHRLPEAPIAHWFAIAAGMVGLVQALDGMVARVTATGPVRITALVVLAFHVAMVLGGIALVHLLGLFPDVRIERPYERRVLGLLWLLLPVAPLALVATETLALPPYHPGASLPNPYHLPALAWAGPAAEVGIQALQAVFVVGAVLLVPRYRRADAVRRRQIRWLLLPAGFAAVVAVTDLAAWRRFPDGAPNLAAEVGLTALWVLAIASLPVAITVALLRPDWVDVDRVIRRSLVYGALWALIAAAYLAAVWSLGLAAGQRLPLWVAIGLTGVATLVFQPVRPRLEQAADRWVFGARTDPARVVADLGAALEGTVALERLLPRMAEALQDGLGLTWARVRLDTWPPTGNGQAPHLAVQILLDGEQLGVVECGPKVQGRLTDEDELVVATLARQAALAVRNVRLTEQLRSSRARLVRAQDAERRRIERDLHDGVQQDLVALLGHAGRARSVLDVDPATAAAALDEVHRGLAHVLTELRNLARGIHPSVLTDQGLLEAVEALAARSPRPISVRADAGLRGARFPAELEGAAYFTVAEGLANAGKHAPDSGVEISLRQHDGHLEVVVKDDGPGFEPATVTGTGLVNLAERVAALDGWLTVDSAPGQGTRLAATLRPCDG